MKNKELVAIAETFADYEFKNGEKGLYYRCLGRTYSQQGRQKDFQEVAKRSVVAKNDLS